MNVVKGKRMKNWVGHNKNMFSMLAFGVISISPLSTTVQAADEQFNDALRAAKAGNITLLRQYQQSMQNDALGYYPEYWLLNQNLASQAPENILQFVQRYPNSAMAEKLAADYIEEKVKLGDFSSPLALINYVSNADRAEACAIAQVRAKNNDPLVFAEYKDVWLTTDSQPASCQGLGRLMQESALMTGTDREQRLWGQLRAGQSGLALSTGQSIGLQLSLSQFNQIQANPQNYLWSAPKNTAEDYAYLIYALGRLADSDLNTALMSVARAAEGTPKTIQKVLYRTVAYIGGTTVMKNNFNRDVLNSFDLSYGLDFSPEEAEIYARQAIRFGAWESVIRAVNAMSVNQKQEDRWQYWLARAAEQRGDRQSAQVIYQRLAQQGDDYHNLLAKDKLGQRTVVHQSEPSAHDMTRLYQDIHFSRAFALREIGADTAYANREWNWAVRQAYLKQDDGLILAATKRAIDISWYDRAIYAADRTVQKHNTSYRYPMPYKNTVVNYSQSAGIDPAWAYGLMRQESRFNTVARSHVGAGGLMQVMPETAKGIAKQLGETYSASALTTIDTNVRYGTHYISNIQRQLSNSTVMATAGYNAGPTRARRWQPEDQGIAADQYAEAIPLLETRDYVKHVMTNATHYGHLLGPNPQPISQRMTFIPARQ